MEVLKRYKIKVSVLLWVILGLAACKTGQRSIEIPKDYIYENALLWQIEGDQLEEPSYLFGTIHLIGSDKFYWPNGTLAAFDESETIVFEIDMNEMTDLGNQLSILTKAFMSDGQTLGDFYSEEDYKTVRQYFEDMGIPMFFLERIKPMFLTVFASGDVDLSGGFGGNSDVKSYEMELFTLADASDKSIGGLETMEYQMSVFDSIPYQDQADMLLETIEMNQAGNDVFVEMENMYVAQRINDMVGSLSEEGGIGGYEDVLLYDRNANWIPLMGEKMTKGQVFFAVGAGHLAGQGGVLHLLQEAGYRVTPLSHTTQ